MAAAATLIAGSAVYLWKIITGRGDKKGRRPISPYNNEPAFNGQETLLSEGRSAGTGSEDGGDEHQLQSLEGSQEEAEGKSSGVVNIHDAAYLQVLLETEICPPKFPVAKNDNQQQASLKKLLDNEWGPPRFAVQKLPTSPSHEDSKGAILGAIDEGMAAGESSGDNRDEAETTSTSYKQSLLLKVISGPAAGLSLNADKDQIEILIGRVSACTLALTADQEVSSRHAVLQYISIDDCWKVTDLGSLNGSALNGITIGTADRKPGKQHVLKDGDILELGGVTQIKIICGPSTTPPSRLKSSAAPNSSTWSPALAARSAPKVYSNTTVKLPALVIAEDLPPLGEAPSTSAGAAAGGGGKGGQSRLRLAVHQRVGTEHLRTNTSLEDVVVHLVPFPSSSSSSLGLSPASSSASSALLCVFDGHQGSKAALKAKSIMPALLTDKLLTPSSSSSSDNAKKGDGKASSSSSSSVPLLGSGLVFGRPQEVQQGLLKEVFLAADKEIAMDEGCTATVVLLERKLLAASSRNDGPPASSCSSSEPSSTTTTTQGLGSLYVQTANVGDSSAVLVNATTGAWRRLTDDHRIANNASERQRLQQKGHATVRKRLYGINISRMLGDRFLKDELPGSFLAEPHVSTPEEMPSSHACFLIVASDGLWDVVSEERAAALTIKAYLEDPKTTSADFIADLLLSQALTLRSGDDITIMVLAQKPAPAPPPPAATTTIAPPPPSLI